MDNETKKLYDKYKKMFKGADKIKLEAHDDLLYETATEATEEAVTEAPAPADGV